MANPFDFDSGAILTAAQLNGIAAIDSYTPSFTGLTVGSATVSSFYTQVNHMVYFGGYITFAADTTIDASLVSTNFPIASNSTGAYLSNIQLNFYDASGNAYYMGHARVKSSTDFYLYYDRTSGIYNYLSNISSTNPFTWTTGDWILWKGTYRAA